MIEFLFFLFEAVLVYVIIFIVWAALKFQGGRFDRFIFCPVCFTFFSVFLLSIFLYFVQDYSPELVNFSAGLSATGIAYKLKNITEQKIKSDIPHGIFFLYQLGITIIFATFLYLIGVLNFTGGLN